MSLVLHDWDAKFCAGFNDVLASEDIGCLKVPLRSPNLNAFGERWVRSEVLQLRIWYGESMRSCRPPLFRKRKFAPEVIVTCVRWYLRFSLSLRDLEELMAERGLAVDHTSIWRSGGGFRPTALRCIGGCTASLSGNRPPGTWMRRLFGLPENGCTCSAPSIAMARQSISSSPKHGIARQPSCFCRKHWPIPTIGSRASSFGMACAVIQPHSGNCRPRVACRGGAAGEPAATAITGSHRVTATSSAECTRCRGHGRRQTGWAVIQGIEAIQTTRKGQVLGITRRNLHGQAWVSRRLLGLA